MIFCEMLYFIKFIWEKKLKGREPCDGNIDENKKAQLTVRIWLQ